MLAVQGDYGTLALTALSDEVLTGRRQVLLRREPPRAPRAKAAKPAKAVAAAAAELPEAAAGLFERLRAWRAAAAKEQGVPAYVIFHDATLRQVAAELPSTLADLGNVSGIGEAKLAKYGQQILICSRHVSMSSSIRRRLTSAAVCVTTVTGVAIHRAALAGRERPLIAAIGAGKFGSGTHVESQMTLRFWLAWLGGEHAAVVAADLVVAAHRVLDYSVASTL